MSEKNGLKAGVKRKAMAAVLLLIFMGAAAVFAFSKALGMGDPVNRNSRAFSKEVKQWISQAQEGDTVSLAELAPFSWNWVYTFDPYTAKAEMEKVLGCSGRELQETVSEGMVQLIFVEHDSALGENKVVGSICAYGSNLGYGVDLGIRFGRRNNYVMLPEGMDRMTLRTEGEYPRLVFEGETFEGVITELYRQSALVSVEEGWPIRDSGDQVFVQLNEEQTKTAAIGDRVKVNYDGMVMESYPLQLGGQMDTVILKDLKE